MSQTFTHVNGIRDLYFVGIHDGAGKFQGTLAASINLFPLHHTITKQMEQQPVDYQVLAPDGALIAARGIEQFARPPAPSTNNDMVITIKPSTRYITKQWHLHIVTSALITIALLLIISGLYWLVVALILKPVESTMNALVPTQHNHTNISLQKKLAYIQAMAHQYKTLQTQLHHSEKRLIESHHIIDQLQHQQLTLMQAAGQQMQQTFVSIAAYSSHMEELIRDRKVDVDQQYYFDEVKEMGDNLHLASEAFYHLCQIKTDAHIAANEPINLIESLKNNAESLRDALDRRNQTIVIHCTDSQPSPTLFADPALIGKLIHSLLYSAIHFAEDEATITIALSNDQNQHKIDIALSHYRRSILPADQ